jgi:hypothetical protein
MAMFSLVGGLRLSARAELLTPDQGESYALVIGNSEYGGGEDDVSGAGDAEIVSKALQDLQFTKVITIKNGSFEEMKEGLGRLAATIEHASVVLVFFSGHGFQDQNDDYLIPAHGSVDPQRSISLTMVTQALASAPLAGALKLVILDACRTLNRSGAAKGLGEPKGTLKNTLYGFAAAFGQTAPSGDSNGYSPYTSALIRHIREPGLDLDDFLGAVKKDLAPFGQVPVTLATSNPLSQFSFRAPVFVTAHASNSSVIAIVHGKVVLTPPQTDARFSLTANENDLIVMVSNPKLYHNGHTWERTSGWSYKLDLIGPNGPLNCPGLSAGGGSCFSASEEVPFKDGPHHGNVFVVAKANLLVSPDSATPTVSVESADTKLWNSLAPPNAQDQDELFKEKVKDLPLDRILDPSKLPNFGVVSTAFLVPLVRELLTTGQLLGQKVADSDRTFFVIHGNKVLKDLVPTCVTDSVNARIADLQASIAAALKRDPTPFSSFDQALTTCVRDAGKRAGSALPLDQLSVWTAIEDHSDEPVGAGVTSAGTSGGLR